MWCAITVESLVIWLLDVNSLVLSVARKGILKEGVQPRGLENSGSRDLDMVGSYLDR